MASSTRIPPAEVDGIYGAIVKRMARKMMGEVPEAIGVGWHNRKVLSRTRNWLGFGLGLALVAREVGQCDEPRRSLAHMAAGIGSRLAASPHGPRPVSRRTTSGLAEAKVREVPRWP